VGTEQHISTRFTHQFLDESIMLLPVAVYLARHNVGIYTTIKTVRLSVTEVVDDGGCGWLGVVDRKADLNWKL